jgi:hypothetical protein
MRTRLRAPFHSNWRSAKSNQGSLPISIQAGNSVRPMHLFGHKFDHDYYFELLGKEERAAHSITRSFTAPIACSELARMRTELF